MATVAPTAATIAPTVAIITPTVAITTPAAPVIAAVADILTPVAVKPSTPVGNAPHRSHCQVLSIFNLLYSLMLICCSGTIDGPFVSILSQFVDVTHCLLYFRQNLVIPRPPEESPIVKQTPTTPVPTSGTAKKASKGDDKLLSIGKSLSAMYVYLYSLLVPYLIDLL